MNLLLATDSYKLTHWVQYPTNTTGVYSYFESRGGQFPAVVFFGLQYILKLIEQGYTPEDVITTNNRATPHFNRPGLFNKDGWLKMYGKYGGKTLPLRIRAVPEGTVVPTRNVLMTVENTDPDFYWLTNYMETLLVQTWYPISISTNSYECKKIILEFLEATGTPEDIGFKLHDFGCRGVTCMEQAGIGGMAHLTSFLGTDTLPALAYADEYYDAGLAAGFSIPASEHSTMTAWLREHEVEAFANMLNRYPKGLVACVSDQYDIYNACRNLWGKELKQEVLSRDGTLVIRPDSGDPVTVVVNVLRILWEQFGGTTNSKGYRVLDPHVRVIQGDGIDREKIREILTAMMADKFSADNIAFGSGGGLLQKFDRDTCEFAFKCSDATVNGEHRDIYKEPKTMAAKNSKRGRLKLIMTDKGTFSTEPEDSFPDKPDMLQTVYENGKMFNRTTFEEVRTRINNSI